MSGLKRISKLVLLMEPTALHAFRTTSRLLASVVSEIQAEHLQSANNRPVNTCSLPHWENEPTCS